MITPIAAAPAKPRIVNTKVIIPKTFAPCKPPTPESLTRVELLSTPLPEVPSTTLDEIIKIDDLLTPTSAEADDQYYCYKVADAYYDKIFKKFY